MRTALRQAWKMGLMLTLVAGLAMSGLALAQTDDTAEEPAAPSVDRPHRAGRVIGTAAEVIGIEAVDLVAALQEEGATLASVAAANGSSGDAIVDALVAQLTERLDEAVADERLTEEEADEKLSDATDRFETLVETENPRLGCRGGHRHGGFGNAEALAEVLGLTTDDLRTAREAGTTLAELAEQQGVPVDDVVDAIVAPLAERLSAAVEAERITQEEADERLAEVTEAATTFVETGEKPEGSRGFGPGRRGPRGGGPGFGGPGFGGPADGTGTGFDV